jgi:RNA polymerase sigma factor (sigma-70 family)
MRYIRDPSSFRELYDCHHERVYALAWRMCSDQRLAEDLTQEVFVKLWDALESYRGDSAFGTWLHRVAVNVIWTHLTRERRSNGWLEPTDGEPQAAMPSHGDAIATRIDLERALATLPHGARVILLLHCVDGYAYREISDALGVDIGTVKSQIHRARRLLQPMLSYD